MIHHLHSHAYMCLKAVYTTDIKCLYMSELYSYSSTCFCTHERVPHYNYRVGVLVLILMKEYPTTTIELEYLYSYS